MLRNTRISSREKVQPFVTAECAKCNSKGQDAIAPFRNFEIAVSYWETHHADCMGSNRFAFFVIERLFQPWRIVEKCSARYTSRHRHCRPRSWRSIVALSLIRAPQTSRSENYFASRRTALFDPRHHSLAEKLHRDCNMARYV